MPLYYYVLDAVRFRGEVVPALAASWRRRSFEPCRPLCAGLVAAAGSFADGLGAGPGEPLVARVADGLPFDRDLWTALAGEILVYSAADLPEVQTNPDALCCLIDPAAYCRPDVPRESFVPIQQAHFGTRDLLFGARFYRPEHAGYNDEQDVIRLAGYLAAIDPARWDVADLQALRGPADDEERQEELDLAREWFPVLQDLYRQAAARGQVVVCETV